MEWKQIVELVPEAETLSEETKSYILEGWGLTWHKRKKRWLFQKKIEGKVQQHHAPREENEILEQVRDAIERLKTEAKLAEADAEHELELRTTPLQKGKPLIAKEIESAAWFQNLIYDLGLQTYHALVNGIDWDEEDAKDHEKAVEKLTRRLNALLELEADADKLEKVELELERKNILFFGLSEGADKLMEKYKDLREQNLMLIAAMDEQSRMNALKLLFLNSVIVPKRQVEERGLDVVGVDEEIVRKLMEGYGR